jgi:ankyrin repeat and SAM domain-containing protein 1
MEKICKVWEIELQAVLEINKIGHRKRILYSLIGQRLEPPNIEEINEESSNILDILLQNESRENNNVKSEPKKPLITNKSISSRHRKNRPAPPPPIQKISNDLEIRAPSELLLSNQGSLQAQWKHSATTLVSGAIKYEVFVCLTS